MTASSKDAGIVVILDDEANMGKILARVLCAQGFDATCFDDPRKALERLRRLRADVLLSDLRMPEMTGEEVLQAVKEENLGCEVILMTAYGTVESAMRCVRQGAYDYVTKPFDTKALVATVRRAVEKGKSKEEPVPAPLPSNKQLLGESSAMQGVRESLRKMAPTDSPVVILGESGTGKELAARALHQWSPRTQKRFVAINCASIPENLMESELFGYEKGAFTGANDTKVGLMEAADGGTLFLDEVGELPLGLQAKLLRALQEREISRVGSVDNIPVNIRVVAATNRKLEESVRAGAFREDLYYRLNVLNVTMPTLRERREDVPLLAQHFLAILRERNHRPDLVLTQDAERYLKQLDWPGNVRQLRNVLERLSVLVESNEITEADVAAVTTGSPRGLQVPAHPTPALTPDPDTSEMAEFREARDSFEANYIRAVLRASKGNVSEAAKKSGISRRNFYEKIEKLKIDPGEFKE